MWKRVVYLLSGGLCFWAPTTAIELVTRRQLNLAVATFLPPAAVILAWLLLRQKINLKNGALWMLAGVFLLGPLFMMAGATAFHGGYMQFNHLRDVWFLVESCLVPPLTLVFAGYDRTLFGVLLAMFFLPLVQWYFNKRGWRIH